MSYHASAPAVKPGQLLLAHLDEQDRAVLAALEHASGNDGAVGKHYADAEGFGVNVVKARVDFAFFYALDIFHLLNYPHQGAKVA